jgi:hypothetical protein
MGPDLDVERNSCNDYLESNLSVIRSIERDSCLRMGAADALRATMG